MDESIFSVAFSAPKPSRNEWGEVFEVKILNPDGSVCVSSEFFVSLTGMTPEEEHDVAEFVGEAAKDFVETYYTAINEMREQNRGY